MSTIRPAQFPRVDTTGTKNPLGKPFVEGQAGSTVNQAGRGPVAAKTDTRMAVASPQNGEEAAQKQPQVPGVRFYHPRSSKQENPPELGKHIDIRV